MINKKIFVNKTVLRKYPDSTAIKGLMAHAWANGLEPELGDATEAVSVRFNKDEAHLIKGSERKRAYPKKHLSGMILAAFKDRHKKEKKVKAEFTFHDKRKFGAQQKEMVAVIAKGIKDQKVLTLEASTGIGKGMALIAAGLKSSAPLLVASPTIKLMRQLIREYLNFNVEHNYSVVMGRHSFVSQKLLLNEIKETGSTCLERWMERQIAGEVDETGNSWLVEDLIEFCDMPAGFSAHLSLDKVKPNKKMAANEIDLGYEAWRDSIEGANCGAKVVFCTHAMLAVDILTRLRDKKVDPADYQIMTQALEEADAINDKKDKAKILSEFHAKNASETKGLFGPRALLIDEGHLLEQSISSFFNDNLSLYAIKRDVKSAALNKAFNAIVKISKAASGNSNPLVKESIYYAAVKKFSKQLELCAIKSKDDEIKKTSWILKRSLEEKQGVSTYIGFSPTYRYPTISYGRHHLGKEMATLWGGHLSAALVSATMSVPVKGFDFVKRTLFIPDNLFSDGGSFESDWLHKNTTVMLPGIKAPFLCRPPAEDDQLQWLEDVAKTIDHIAEQAPGGVLILASSHDVVDLLSKLINDETYGRLVSKSGSRKTSFEQAEKAFKQNKRPVWLATGRAWTGLDLYDAENPSLLTDLAVINLPFGMNNTVSSIKRIERQGFSNIEPYDVAIRAKQAIGRARRRDDNTQRKIWILDNRAVAGRRSGLQHYTIPMSVLKGYKKAYFSL